MPASRRRRSSPCTCSMAPTSTPRVGWQTSSTVGSCESARARTSFCALPPDSRPAGSNRCSADIERLNQLPGVALDRGAVEDAGPAEGRPVEALEHEVVGDGEVAQQRPAIPVGSDVAEPGGEPLPRRRARHIVAGEQDRPLRGRRSP